MKISKTENSNFRLVFNDIPNSFRILHRSNENPIIPSNSGNKIEIGPNTWVKRMKSFNLLFESAGKKRTEKKVSAVILTWNIVSVMPCHLRMCSWEQQQQQQFRATTIRQTFYCTKRPNSIAMRFLWRIRMLLKNLYLEMCSYIYL